LANKDSDGLRQLSHPSKLAIAILAVDDIHVNADDRNRLQRLDSGVISHQEALQEVESLARQLAHKKSKQ